MSQPTPLFTSLEGISDLQGEIFGPSSWYEVTQEDIDRFAVVTRDFNPIHIDAEYAAKSRYGVKIAHGLLTVGLLVPMLREIFGIEDASLRINYGLDRVRFPAVVPVGARLRLRGEVKKVSDIQGGKQVTLGLAHELEGETKPACVLDFIAWYYS